MGVAVLVGRPRIGALTEDEDGEEAVEVEALLEVEEGAVEVEALLEVEVDIKDKVSEGESVRGALLNAF